MHQSVTVFWNGSRGESRGGRAEPATGLAYAIYSGEQAGSGDGPAIAAVVSLTVTTKRTRTVPPLVLDFAQSSGPSAEEFVSHRLRMLLEGQVGYVISGLRRLLNAPDLRGPKRRTVTACIGYYENNRDHMRYDEYLAAGYPIGSGVAEGACRHLVKDRME